MLRLVPLFLACIFFCGYCTASTPSASAPAHRSVPDNGKIIITDFGLRSWGPALVHYFIDVKKFKPGTVVLVDSANAAIPFQITHKSDGSNLLEFVAVVQKGSSSHYSLVKSDHLHSATKSSLYRRTVTDTVELGNSWYSLRLPAPCNRSFTTPVRSSDVVTPLFQWKQNGSDWMGNSHFFTARNLKGYDVSCVDSGDATIAYRARYHFAPRGEYVCEIRVSEGVPAAVITEEFDFGEITEGTDFLMLGVGENWTPETIGFLYGTEQISYEPMNSYLEKQNARKNIVIHNICEYPAPEIFKPGDNLTLLDKIGPNGTWGVANGIDLRRGKSGDVGSLSLSVAPWFAGSWRRGMALIAWNDPKRGVQIALPLGVRKLHWYQELVDDDSPFSTQEHDPSLPESYGRRVWALGFGLDKAVQKFWPDRSRVNPIAQTREVLGYIGLDRYKDWIVDWPENKAITVYPHAYATPEIIARLKKNMATHPDRDILEQLYMINGKTESAIKSARRTLEFLKNPDFNDWSVPGLTGYMQAYSFLRVAWAEDALACPDLPVDLRQGLRQKLAVYANLLSEPDYNPRGIGCHLGNPNMPIGRSLALVEVASLLPDHPLYAYWMANMHDYTAFKLATLTEPGGAWFEPPTYQMYGPTRSLSLAQVILRNSGFGDLAQQQWHARALEYNANLTMPDVRYKGWRILPGMGNSGNTLEATFGIAAGVVEKADPKEAGFFRNIHSLASGNNRVCLSDNELAYAFTNLPDISQTPRPMVTTFIPGYGVAFRAHFGSPDETGMLFRCGFNKSHWDTDDLNTILYSKGAPLSPGTGYQYYSGVASKNNAIYHNRIKVGTIDALELFGRAENTIQDYGFCDHADYAVGREYLPPEWFTDGKGEMEWRRHILFVKSERPDGANYFVMRETFPGGKDRPTWWHWLNLDGPEMISTTGNVVDMKTKYGAATRFWFAGCDSLNGKPFLTFDYGMSPNYFHRNYGKALGVPDQDAKETKTIYRIAGKPGAEYFYVVYPHKDTEKNADFKLVAPGCIKVTSSEAIDYTFVSDSAFNFTKDDIVFTGKAGAVRIFSDRVVLCMNSGSGRIGYKGYLVEGNGPFERTIMMNSLKSATLSLKDGYEKKIVSVDIGKGIIVRGELPFTATLDGEKIRIKTSGRTRVLQVSRPSFIGQAQLTVDGQKWMIFWTEAANSDWGRFKDSRWMSASVPDGNHELVISQRTFPPVWQRQFEPLITGVQK